MYINNPDEVQLTNIKMMQAKGLAQLNELETWTDYEFDVALECYKVWWPIEKEWQPNSEGLNYLINNHRVPASKMKRMKESYNRIVTSKSFLSDRQN